MVSIPAVRVRYIPLICSLPHGYHVSIPAVRVRYIASLEEVEDESNGVSIPAVRVRYIVDGRKIYVRKGVSIPAVRVRYIFQLVGGVAGRVVFQFPQCG